MAQKTTAAPADEPETSEEDDKPQKPGGRTRRTTAPAVTQEAAVEPEDDLDDDDDFDLDDFDPVDQPMPLELIDPNTGMILTRKGQPVVLMIAGPESVRMKTHERRVQDRRLQSAQRTGRMNLTAAQIENEVIARVARSITGWQNIWQKGKEVPYSEEAAKELIAKRTWIREQVDTFYQNRGNFMAGRAS